ncbi:hypothetical protein BDM02DRAFT_260888 [Thelephora ganbajun]|uniref:Uncharacterized protein n=1 Tax=Thelephora ganbajun TaxID=370292 RepID=A0ACB6Z9J5_THEGA|nr:hypothetical protein BDM02DRAFT_260888 [Thelephora ganbajun]
MLERFSNKSEVASLLARTTRCAVANPRLNKHILHFSTMTVNVLCTATSRGISSVFGNPSVLGVIQFASVALPLLDHSQHRTPDLRLTTDVCPRAWGEDTDAGTDHQRPQGADRWKPVLPCSH